ncbi:hypothetical protein ACIA8C_27090 [Nocardia sp. NPDC051321]|uniref:hypothetical protein n=1 Tax=Nocardia sp. NPDC051321 TaxID=3364323 RepID=UPI0037A8208D
MKILPTASGCAAPTLTFESGLVSDCVWREALCATAVLRGQLGSGVDEMQGFVVAALGAFAGGLL